MKPHRCKNNPSARSNESKSAMPSAQKRITVGKFTAHLGHLGCETDTFLLLQRWMVNDECMKHKNGYIYLFIFIVSLNSC